MRREWKRFLLFLMILLVVGLVACDGAGGDEEAAASESALAVDEPGAEAAAREAAQDGDLDQVDGEPLLEACAYSQGYWKNHPGSWDVEQLTLGDTSYDQEDLLEILETAPRGDATYILAHQLIAAELNLENDADTIDAISQAQAWLAEHPLGTDPEAEREEAIMLAETLDDYNNGLLAAAACDEIEDDEIVDDDDLDDDDLDDDDDLILVDDCTYGQGYWKNHPDAWDVDTLTLGDVTYTQDELLALLDSPPQGDATYVLLHQLIAAELNLENGAESIAEIDDANLWLAANPPGTDPDGDLREEGIALSETLEAYNDGELVAVACEDVEDDDDDDDLDDDACTGADPHPHAQDLANRYGVSYEEIMDWFCDGYGFGEIEIAFNLADETGLSVAEIMEMRASGLGWGQIRQELGASPGLGRGKPNPGNGGNPPGQDDNPGRGNNGNPPGQDGNPGRGNSGNPPGQSDGNPGRGND